MKSATYFFSSIWPCNKSPLAAVARMGLTVVRARSLELAGTPAQESHISVGNTPPAQHRQFDKLLPSELTRPCEASLSCR